MRAEIFLCAVIGMAVLSDAAAQKPPSAQCLWEGMADNARLGIVARAQPAWSTAHAGDPFVLSHSEGEWSCGYYANRKGAGPLWIRTSDVRFIETNPNPSLTAWVGTWDGGEDHVRIRLSPTSGQLEVEGDAEWHGFGDNVHTGSLAGNAAPAGNHLHVVEGEAESCTVDMTLIGDYIIARDNQKCGGMNVQFGGIWKRAARK